jgi:hypothetical protein
LHAQTEAFIRRERFRQVIDSHHQVVGHFEYAKLAMISTHGRSARQTPCPTNPNLEPSLSPEP